MKDIFFFDAMLTPKIITFVYWVLLLIAIVSGLMAMRFGGAFKGIVMIVVGCIGARIWCELAIVLFKINENLRTIAERSELDQITEAR